MIITTQRGSELNKLDLELRGIGSFFFFLQAPFMDTSPVGNLFHYLYFIILAVMTPKSGGSVFDGE